MRATFSKNERLKSRKLIEQLFKDGESFAVFPVRLVWKKTDASTGEFPVQASFSVSKKAFPTAVARNRIRRLLRETYRLNKHILYEKLDGAEARFAFMFIYSGKEELPFSEIETSMKKVLQRWLKKEKET